MIYQEIGFEDFIQAFARAGRARQFSLAGMRALFEYYDDDDTETALDVIALCCEWAEADAATIVADYGYVTDLQGIYRVAPHGEGKVRVWTVCPATGRETLAAEGPVSDDPVRELVGDMSPLQVLGPGEPVDTDATLDAILDALRSHTDVIDVSDALWLIRQY